MSDFLDRHGFDCGCVSGKDGATMIRAGKFADHECVSALNLDFFDPATSAALASYLEGKSFPQISSRGNCWVLSGLTPNGEVLSIYGKKPSSDVRTLYIASQKIWLDLKASLFGLERST